MRTARFQAGCASATAFLYCATRSANSGPSVLCRQRNVRRQWRLSQGAQPWDRSDTRAQRVPAAVGVAGHATYRPGGADRPPQQHARAEAHLSLSSKAFAYFVYIRWSTSACARTARRHISMSGHTYAHKRPRASVMRAYLSCHVSHPARQVRGLRAPYPSCRGNRPSGAAGCAYTARRAGR